MDTTLQNQRADELEEIIPVLDTAYEDGQDCMLPLDTPDWVLTEFKLDKSEPVSDQKYDMIRDCLKKLRPDSDIFQNVTASKQQVKGKKIKHAPPLTSIHKSNHEFYYVKLGKFLKWLNATTAAIKHTRKNALLAEVKVPVEKLTDKEKKLFKSEALPTSGSYPVGELEVELKYDGVCVALYYEDGVLVKAGNRSRDGNGEDITENVKYIDNVPQKLKLPVTCRITGEVICRLPDFAKVQAELKKRGDKARANPRNHASGALRQFIDPKKTAEGRLFFIGHGIDGLKKLPYRTGEERAKWANQQLGIRFSRVTPFVFDKLAELEKLVSDLEYEVDGAVVSVADLAILEEMGRIGDKSTGEPRGKEAWKFAEEVAMPIVKSIDWQLGRTGAITPVANFNPVRLAGTDVKRATLHNIGFMFRHNIDVGAQVKVLKSGKIIPKVVGVVKPHKGDVSYPDRCPACGKKTTLHTSGGDMYELLCKNENCGSRAIGQFCHFLKVMGILGLGDKSVELLLQGGVKEYADLFKLNERTLMKCDFSKRESLLAIARIRAIEKPENLEDWELEAAIEGTPVKRKVPLAQFLTALGIDGVGRNTGASLASHYGTLEAVLSASENDLQSIEDVGPKTAKSIREFVAKSKATVLRLAAYLEPEMPKTGKLSGKSFCFSGGLPEGKEYWQKKIVDRGGQIKGSMSARVNFLVVGSDPGDKVQKAQTLGVPTITLDQLKRML